MSGNPPSPERIVLRCQWCAAGGGRGMRSTF